MAKFPGAVQYPVRWWGMPTVHNPRRIKPSVLMVVHQTGNSRLPSAIGEATYSNRDGSGASFTFVTNRDGTLVQCLDPVTQTPWTNGDVNAPQPRAQKHILARPGYNFNEYCFMTVENVAYLDTAPITAAQKETLAQLAAWGHKETGLPINRDTILGHRDINSVSRWNCPTTGDLDKFLDDIIVRARAIAGEEDPAVIAELEAQLAECRARSQSRLRALRNARDEIAALTDQLAGAVMTQEDADALRTRINNLKTRLNGIKEKVAALATDVGDD